MVDGIGRTTGSNYGGYPTAGNGNIGKGDENNTPTPAPSAPETQLDPKQVMDFMARNNYFVPIAETTTMPNLDNVDPALRERVELSIENYEVIMQVITDEFGEDLADAVMTMVMDSLLDMAA